MLEVKKLSKKFGENLILNNLSFEMLPGEVIAVVGPSGSGKSTLLRSINQIVRPDAGTVIFKGKEIFPGTGENRPINNMGMIFQHFNLFPNLTVLENITLAPQKVLGQTKSESELTGMNLLKKVQLDGLENRYPAKLSGGQKQRVAIARALAMKPELLLLDEVTSALDPELVGEVTSIIEELASSESLTHCMIYDSDPRLQCVIHIHNEHLWRKYLNVLPTSHSSYGSVEQAMEVNKLVKAKNSIKIIIMAGHFEGILVYGETIEIALNTLEKLSMEAF
jgi:polar amino acid transport system ATP-binding protein